jgi:TIR domain-containing protein/uncharacterized protein DUF4384
MSPEKSPEVFISYTSKDRDKVVDLAAWLERAGVGIWRDQNEILGGENYGPKIVNAIKNAKVLLVCCSDAAMRSKNVKQEIQLAWHYNVAYFPVMLELVNYPEQVEYWLHGWQYVKLFDEPIEIAVSKILAGLGSAGVGSRPAVAGSAAPGPISVRRGDLDELWGLARLTDQIWPVAVESDAQSRPRLRDLGEPQTDLQRGFRLGSHVRLAIETDRDSHLLLLDRGTSGRLYCLCPSAFAPDQTMRRGLNFLPQQKSPHPTFAVTGKPGNEHLLAILSDEPLCVDWWSSNDARGPARQLSENDIAAFIHRLRQMPGDRWVALATYFEILAG